MDLNEVWAEMGTIGAKIELNEGGHPILNVPDGKAMSEESFNTIVRRLPDLRSFLRFKEWNGTTKLGTTIAVDTETFLIDKKNKGAPPPKMVIGTAWDGNQGLFLFPHHMPDFLNLHQDSKLIFHNSTFDLSVIRQECGPAFDVDQFVDRLQVGDTQILEYLLHLATTGKRRQLLTGETTLQALSEKYLQREMIKDETRETFSQFVDQPLDAFPIEHQVYAAIDTVNTLDIWIKQNARRQEMESVAKRSYGFNNMTALNAAWAKYGFLGVSIWIKAGIVFDAMKRTGLGTNKARRKAMLDALDQVDAEVIPILEQHKIPIGAGSDLAVQKYLKAKEKSWLESGVLKFPLKRTPKGAICFDSEARKDIAAIEDDPLLVAIGRHKQSQKFRKTYAEKITGKVLHPDWEYGLASGRVGCTGDLAAQTLPNDYNGETGEFSIRQGVQAAIPGWLLLGADFGMLEIVSLAHFLESVGYGADLADCVRQGLDIHIAVAHCAVGDRIGPVTSQERKRAKPIDFGLPGTLGIDGLKRSAKKDYGVVLSDDEVKAVVDGYRKLNPAIDKHLKDKKNLGVGIADAFDLKTSEQGWELFHVAKGTTKLEPEDQVNYWKRMERLPDMMGFGAIKGPAVAKLIAAKKPHPDLAKWIRMLGSEGSYISTTGRIRNRAKFGAQRNGVFQSPAADGAILCTWELYRAGFQICGFIHDEVLCQVPPNVDHKSMMDQLCEIMIQTMSETLGGLPIKVEPFLRSSLSARDEVEIKPVEELPPKDYFYTPTEPKVDPEPVVENGQFMSMVAAEKKPRSKKRDQVKSRNMDLFSPDELPF